MNEGTIGKTVRRRRRWYVRRLRIRRALLGVAVGLLIAGACWLNAARYLALPTLHSSQVLPASFWERTNFRRDRSFAAVPASKSGKNIRRIPGVYPYSVVPGGVKDPSDLHYAALRDPVVRRHYSHFDFQHAQLIRTAETREVFLSYRIRDTVFWTRKRVRLHAGELLLTDGKITARARCGNQISDTAKPEVSEEEPDEDVLDQPVIALATAPGAPIRPMLSAPDLPPGRPFTGSLHGRFHLPLCLHGPSKPFRKVRKE